MTCNYFLPSFVDSLFILLIGWLIGDAGNNHTQAFTCAQWSPIAELYPQLQSLHLLGGIFWSVVFFLLFVLSYHTQKIFGQPSYVESHLYFLSFIILVFTIRTWMHFGLIFICGVAVLLSHKAERPGCPASESGLFVDVVTSEQKRLYPHRVRHMDSLERNFSFYF